MTSVVQLGKLFKHLFKILYFIIVVVVINSGLVFKISIENSRWRLTGYGAALAALFYSPVDSPMHQTCIRVMHV